ncbi:hypothetical protein QQS21_000754 [Conoideocrella luteorostrata]|uniref:Uncharacterized protein n=1 Tax=Conoideocrella luteorostrata TaxID=1105319 RepID=A0AAJ0D0X5_9HYPO|nr:hypothetical protein QQS21_000754 [Conoideocrella luteorostrata]
MASETETIYINQDHSPSNITVTLERTITEQVTASQPLVNPTPLTVFVYITGTSLQELLPTTKQTRTQSKGTASIQRSITSLSTSHANINILKSQPNVPNSTSPAIMGGNMTKPPVFTISNISNPSLILQNATAKIFISTINSLADTSSAATTAPSTQKQTVQTVTINQQSPVPSTFNNGDISSSEPKPQTTVKYVTVTMTPSGGTADDNIDIIIVNINTGEAVCRKKHSGKPCDTYANHNCDA